jgi:hypothetical protein
MWRLRPYDYGVNYLLGFEGPEGFRLVTAGEELQVNVGGLHPPFSAGLA